MARGIEKSSRMSLEFAKTHWFFGDWRTLAAYDLDAVQSHPDRGRLALLIGSAQQQLGDHEAARRFIRQSLAWGCPQSLVARIMIAGVHNTLGRVSALKQDPARIARHFKAAVVGSETPQTKLACHARSVREMATLGLLPQVASELDEELKSAKRADHRPQEQASRLRVLETEVELLRSALVQAQSRQQLYPRQEGGGVQPAASHATADGRAELKNRSVSQLGQDLWVLEQTGYKRVGFFVEFGASDGVILSNTLLLERDFQWRGICAEPNPKLFSELRQNRKCQVSDACIGATSGEEVEFLLADEFGGMLQHAALDNNAERRRGYAEDPQRIVRLRTLSLNDWLIRMGAPRHIDYLSIDTEGSELEILSAFPFEDWQIDLITVEHNFTPQREEIRRLLESKGYSRLEAEWDDWYSSNNRAKTN